MRPDTISEAAGMGTTACSAVLSVASVAVVAEGQAGTGMWVALGSILTAIGAIAINLYTARSRVQQEQRADALTGWQTLTDKLQAANAQLHKDLDAAHTAYTTAYTEQQRLIGQVAALQQQVGGLEAKVAGLQQHKQELEAKLAAQAQQAPQRQGEGQ